MRLDELLNALASKGVTLWSDGDQLRLRAPKGAVTAADQATLKSHKDEILTLLRQKNAAAGAAPAPLVPIRREGPLPVSFAQERLWFLAQMNPESPVYNLPSHYRLEGALDVGALRESLEAVVHRHEVLRTTLQSIDGRLAQVVDTTTDAIVSIVDLRALAESDRDDEAMRLARIEAETPFDLARGPLCRITLLELRDADHRLLLTLHHSVSDGWSSMVFLRDLRAFYEERTGGAAAELPTLPVHYADYATWERQWLQGDVLEDQLAYWRSQLGGELPVLELPASRARPAVASYQGGKQSFEIPSQVLDGVKSLSQRHGVTLFMTLVAAFATLLHRYSGQTDVVIGSPIAHRTRREIEDVIGCFINTLPLRTDLTGDPSFTDLLTRVKETCLQAFAHQDLPFEKLVEALQPQRDLSHSPIFQAMLILHVQDTRKINTLGPVSITPMEVHTPTSKFDLTLELTEVADGFRGWLEYSTDLFDADAVEQLGGHFQTLLESIVADPGQTVGDLPLLSEGQRARLLVDWNATSEAFPASTCMYRLFEEQAARTPDRLAVACGDRSLSYGELNARANRLARRLRESGVGRDTLVGLCLERSVELLIALLGVAKAGGAYVPLDPIYPKDRIAYILDDSGAAVLVTERALSDIAPDALDVLCLDQIADDLARRDDTNLDPVSEASDLAYVIYTSGSTGKPKGVMVEHRSLVNFLLSMARRPGLSADDVLLSVTTVSFDIAALELYLPLVQGATVVVATAPETGDARALSALIETAGATVLQATPATWHMLLDAGWKGSPTLRVLCGGEALPRELAQRLVDKVDSLWNMYGPTETTIWSAVERVSLDDGGPIAIGRPIANTQLYVLDSRLRPVPPGVTGELFIGGDGLARGYWKRPELTTERFLEHTLAGERRRLYRTGDYARYLPDGRLECLGRTDHQVKIRGFRIELGEIETVLTHHPGVQSAVVMPQTRAGHDTRLAAYVVTDPYEEPTVSELRRSVRKTLPEYMVPAAFHVVDSFPLTPNGKVDRRALAASQGLAEDSGSTFAPPRTETEQLVARVWEDVLGVSRVGLHDNFFDLGGHSLLSMKVIIRLEQETGRTINPREIFLQTLQQLAASLTSTTPESVETR